MIKKGDFILAAINDTQATIRAIDVKVAALLTGLLIPLSSLGKIWAHLAHVYSASNSNLTILVGAIFVTAWLIAVLSLVRTMSAIDNPSVHIVNSNKYKGSFYGGGLFEFGWPDVLMNRRIIKAGKDVSSFSQDYPVNDEDVISELTFEHMKLVYIREMKLHRLKYSVRIATFWLITGLGIYVYSKMS